MKSRRALVAFASVIVLLGAVMALGLGSSAQAGSKQVRHERPHAALRTGTDRAHSAFPTAYNVTAFTQEFSSKKYFCPAGSGNAPCDGNTAAGDYGTIDIVPSHFSNGGYGNYAPSTKALVGSHFALVSGSATENQGVDCPEPNVSEYCTGPYALFGTGAAEGAENVFPSGGFTVTSDLYLDPSTIGAAGTTVNDDVELNTSIAKYNAEDYGWYGTDNTTWACETATQGIEISLNGDCSGTASPSAYITTAGWYRFVFDFSNVSGDVYLTQSVLQETSNLSSPSLVFTSGAIPVTAAGLTDAATNWGGPGYFWLFQDDVNGLGLANFALQLGDHADGNTP